MDIEFISVFTAHIAEVSTAVTRAVCVENFPPIDTKPKYGTISSPLYALMRCCLNASLRRVYIVLTRLPGAEVHQAGNETFVFS